MQDRMRAVEEGVKEQGAEIARQRDARARFESDYIASRQRFFEQQSNLAQATLANGQCLARLETEIGSVKKSVGEIGKGMVALQASLDKRLGDDAEEKGRLLAELAELHQQDSELETEVTEVKAANEAHLATVTRLETERSSSTLRTGALTGFGGAVLSYLKANPDALEKVAKYIGHLFAS